MHAVNISRSSIFLCGRLGVRVEEGEDVGHAGADHAVLQVVIV
jgi:hypothetical protein